MGDRLDYQWQVDRGDGFTDLTEDANHQGVRTSELTIVNTKENMGGFRYRLSIRNNCSGPIFSDPAALGIRDAPDASFSYRQQGAVLSFENLTPEADSVFWDFGDGNTSSLSDPEHTYAGSGTYTITFTIFDACGTDSDTQTATVVAPPNAAFIAENPSGCLPHAVRFKNASSGRFSELLWSFPGGQPATSTAEEPVVTYAVPGDYDVTLTVSGNSGSSSITQDGIVKVRTFPEVAFDYEITSEGENEMEITFINRSAGAESYRWDFGDGNESQEENPVHVFDSSGVFEVTLNAQNGSCASALGKTVAIFLTSTPSLQLPESLKVFPNPTNGQVNLQSDDPSIWPLQIRIFNASGQGLEQITLNGSNAIDLTAFPPGVYFIGLHNEHGRWLTRIVLVE